MNKLICYLNKLYRMELNIVFLTFGKNTSMKDQGRKEYGTARSSRIHYRVLGRREIVTALRLRSGHIPCNKFSYLMRKITSPNCLSCNVIDGVINGMCSEL
ncbi:Non-LTR retrotransposon CATS [Operophtera brumata]|uniref:Non-LTR retrotransposon CATS n=1 Tax=Operophtera brumata TaxID=104452 RepID=A0A0L7L6H8_OPEBR|nr:Non-LTR retrotransposon CATS [Operophtera brumata]